MKHIVIPKNKHVFVSGMTGTGKSYLCEHFLRTYDYVVKLDTKNETDERRFYNQSAWNGLVEHTDFDVTSDFYELDEIGTPKIIYNVDFENQNIDHFNEFFNWIFQRGNTILWIDELMSIGTVQKYPPALGRLLQQGRSKNIGVWCCTQRPSGIPSITLANSSYFFIFDMALPNDRKKLMETTGMPEMLERPSGYNFWYYRMGDKKCVKACLKN